MTEMANCFSVCNKCKHHIVTVTPVKSCPSCGSADVNTEKPLTVNFNPSKTRPRVWDTEPAYSVTWMWLDSTYNGQDHSAVSIFSNSASAANGPNQQQAKMQASLTMADLEATYSSVWSGSAYPTYGTPISRWTSPEKYPTKKTESEPPKIVEHGTARKIEFE